jgi:hypothetical protein
VHEAALKDALKAPTEFETILHALERPEVAAAVRDQDRLAMARLRGIEAKRRMLSPRTVVCRAPEKAGEILTISRQAVEKRRKAGRLDRRIARAAGLRLSGMAVFGTRDSARFGGGPRCPQTERRLDEASILHERECGN